MSSTACQEEDNYKILGKGKKHLDISYIDVRLKNTWKSYANVKVYMIYILTNMILYENEYDNRLNMEGVHVTLVRRLVDPWIALNTT